MDIHAFPLIAEFDFLLSSNWFVTGVVVTLVVSSLIRTLSNHGDRIEALEEAVKQKGGQ